ncbi:MAG TPA: hypothetical protein VKG44_09630, partial [Candidatus Baltobacteraceae bacterium]|nr:hypothetical protein [Candidatus Baltobacteraceae bacterium]
ISGSTVVVPLNEIIIGDFLVPRSGNVTLQPASGAAITGSQLTIAPTPLPMPNATPPSGGSTNYLASTVSGVQANTSYTVSATVTIYPACNSTGTFSLGNFTTVSAPSGVPGYSQATSSR